MRFIAWYCHKCNMYFRELELSNHNCPECGGSVIPQPVKTQEEPELMKAIAQIDAKVS